jgi:penicillin amidase
MPPIETRKQSHALRNTAAGVLLLIGLCFLAGWWLVHRSLSELDGTLTIPELKEPVTVDRDRWGIPWIRANSLEDLETAQGYVVAQDRLWQMDVLRRAAAGELSEIFGKIALPLDRENRTLGLRLACDDAAKRMDPETQLVVEAYARGVNRYIEDHRGRLPLEFRLLRYGPRPWTPTDTFLISSYMWKTLTTTWKAKLNRARLTAIVGPEKARDLFVVDSPLDHYIVGETSSPGTPGGTARAPNSDKLYLTDSLFVPASLQAWVDARALLAPFDGEPSEITGSNNFVVNGSHTASGKPLLANDTHLGLNIPDIWYLLHVTAPGWNVQGFALPGAPLVIIGHNNRIAWGFTNSNAEVQDLYVETFNPTDPLEYRVNGAWMKAQLRKELIHVKGQPDEVLDVVVTRHGPIIRRDEASGGGRAYALRWTLTEPAGMDFAYPLLGRANNWIEFLDVMRHISGPGQNTVFADVDGNLGFALAARIPLRKTGDGALPVPGDTDDYEWTGYIPFDDLPKTINPPAGIIATANARTVGPGYKYFLSDRWAGPSRTERIYELLTGRTDLRPSDFNAVQNDIVSLPDKFLAQQLLNASQTRQPADSRARDILSRLSSWDGRAASGSVETSFLEYTRHMLMKNLLRPYVGENTTSYELWEPDSEYANIWWRDKIFLENVLRHRSAVWLPKDYTSYDELLMASADQAVEQISKRAGTQNVFLWNWGRLHPLEMDHPIGRSGILQRLLSIGPVESDGTVDTVKAMGHGHGPAMRFVADLSNFDNSLMEIATGESGQYGSPYYRDQFPEWFAGRGIPAPFSEAAEDRARVHRLRLVPASASPASH